eukprot:TRINITY_DN4761_c0_g1_i1.p1 TRINITY_DN4761_c0_g1~~TRINITY_DN4761_c0_g1_i1.p1  ORF type:complete len:2262 (+),score=813.42 TRINITY_DN4761_c0_g1_i1:696-7481(+)
MERKFSLLDEANDSYAELPQTLENVQISGRTSEGLQTGSLLDETFFFGNQSKSPVISQNHEEKEESNVSQQVDWSLLGGIQTQREQFDPSQCDDYLAHLQRSSSLHETFLQARQRQEEAVRQIDAGLWSFHTEQRVAHGICSDENQLAYRFNSRKAELNQANIEKMKRVIEDLHRLNVGPVFSSLFEVSMAELSTTHFLQSNARNYSKSVKGTKEILDKLFGLLGDTQTPLSGQTISIVRQLVLMMASYLIGNKDSSSDSLISLEEEDEEDDHLAKEGENASTLLSYFLNRLFNSHSGGWASSLLQITNLREAIFQIDVLGTIFREDIGAHYEVEYLAIITQLPWSQLPSLSSEEAANHVLIPVEKFMGKALEKGFTKLVLLLGKLVLLISQTFPGLTLRSFFLMQRAPWPAPILLSPLFPYFLWDQIETTHLLQVFMEIYRIGTMRFTDYCALVESQKSQFRVAFLEFLLISEQLLQSPSVKQSMADLGGVSNFPILTLMRRFGRLMSDRKEGSSMVLITAELFWLAMVSEKHGATLISSAGRMVPPQTMAWLSPCCKEATTQLVQLVGYHPNLLSSVVQMIGGNLEFVDYNQVTDFFAQFGSWTPGIGSLNWMSFFLARKTFPEVGDPTKLLDREDLWINHYLRTNTEQVSPHIRVEEMRVGLKLIQSIDFESTDSHLRMILSLVVLGSRNAGMSAVNMWSMMLDRRMGWKLVKSPIENRFAFRILQLPVFLGIPPPPNSPPFNEFLVLLQVQLAITLLEEDVQKKGDDQSWLFEMSFFEKLEFVLLQLLNANVAAQLSVYLVTRVLESLIVLAPRDARFLQRMGKLFSELLKKPSVNAPSSFTESIVTSISTLSGNQKIKNEESFRIINTCLVITMKRAKTAETRKKWTQFWTHLLSFGIPNDSAVVSLLDTLVRGLFCNEEDIKEVTAALTPKKITRKDLERMISDGNVWAAYAGLFTILPVLPSESSSTFGVSTFNKNLKESRIWVAKELASQVSDGVLALLFWEEFFSLYFEAITTNPNLAQKLVEPNVKAQLSRTFTSIAQTHQNESMMRIYRIYYSFTTWSKDVIFGSTLENNRIFHFPSRYSEEERYDELLSASLEAFQVLQKKFPPPWTSRTNNSSVVANEDLPSSSPSSPEVARRLHVSPDVVLDARSTFPHPNPPPSRNSFQSFANFLGEVSRTMERIPQLEATLSSENALGEGVLPVVDLLRSELKRFHLASNELLLHDQGLIDCVKVMYRNEVKRGQIKVACYLGQNCAGPGLISFEANQVVPGAPGVQEEIAHNRQLFGEQFDLLFKSARSLAKNLTVLKYLIKSIQKQNHEKIGIQLFFALTSLVLSGEIPSVPISENISGTAHQLGMQFVKSNADFQEQLLLLLFTTPQTEPRPDLGLLISCFNPRLFIERNEKKKYLECLTMLASGLSQMNFSQEKKLAERFEIFEILPQIVGGLNDSEIDQFLVDLPSFLVKPSLEEISASIVSTLLSLQFPKYLEQVLNVLIFCCRDSASSASSWDSFLDGIDFSKLDEVTARKILNALSSHLPLPLPHMKGILNIGRSLILECPAIVNKILEEKASMEEAERSGEESVPHEIWNEMREFFGGCVSSSIPAIDQDMQEEGVEESPIIPMGEIVVELVNRLCPPYVNRFYTFYLESVVPILRGRDEGNRLNLSTLFYSWYDRLPWSMASFHYRDPKAIETLISLIPLDALVLSSFFCKLNWNQYFHHYSQKLLSQSEGERSSGDLINLSEEEFNSFDPKVLAESKRSALQFLRFFIFVHLATPESIPEDLKKSIMSSPSNGGLFPWRRLDPSSFLDAFTGRTLLDFIVECSGCFADPSKSLMDALMLLSEVAYAINQPFIKAVVVSEARALLFVTLESRDTGSSFWHLPFRDTLGVLTTILIPLARSSAADNVLSQCLIGIYSCLNNLNSWPAPRLLHDSRNFLFFNDKQPVSQSTPGYKEFASKLEGIITQFSTSLGAKLAKESLNILPQAINSSHQLTNIYEEILRAYLSNLEGEDPDHSPMGQLVSNMQIPSEYSLVSFMQLCGLNGAALTLLVTMEQGRRNLEEDAWLDFTGDCIEAITSFQPNFAQHHECDVFALWFFVLDSLKNPKWKFEKKVTQQLKGFEKHLSDVAHLNVIQSILNTVNISLKPKALDIELGARVTYILLQRTMISLKKDFNNIKNVSFDESTISLKDGITEKEVDGLVERTGKLRGKTEYQRFVKFIDEILPILEDSQVDTKKFQSVLLQNLAPLYLYLENIH